MTDIPKELPNFKSIEIPKSIDKEDYETNQRRAELYERALEANGVKNLDKTYAEIGDEYGMSSTTINDDLNIVREYIINEEFDTRRMKETLGQALQWAIEEATKEGDYNAIPRIIKEKKKLAQDLGALDKAAKKHEIEHSGDGFANELRNLYEADDGDSDEA